MVESNIVVFIPCYRCAKQIERVISQLDANIQSLIGEVVIIDNISPDNTIQSAIDAVKKHLNNVKITVIQNNANYSLGGSIKSAFLYAMGKRYQYLMILHGDDQADIRDFRNILTSKEYTKYDMTIGARFHKKSTLIGYSKFRTIGNIGFNLFASIITMKRIDDMIAGLNIYNVNFFRDKTFLNFPNNLTFDAHLLLYGIANKANIQYIPITWREEDQLSNAKVFKQGMILLRLFTLYFFIRKKIFLRLQKNTIKFGHKVLFEQN